MDEKAARRLELMGVAVVDAVLKEDMLIRPQCNTVRHWMTDKLITMLNGYLWGERLEGREIEYPDGWWEAFKDRWFPDWLKARFPVKNVSIETYFHVLYPDFRPAVEGHRYIVEAKERHLNEDDVDW